MKKYLLVGAAAALLGASPAVAAGYKGVVVGKTDLPGRPCADDTGHCRGRRNIDGQTARAGHARAPYRDVHRSL